MKTHLKIKAKTLADEARNIRLEEKRWKGTHPMRESLYRHRIDVVRRESRAANLAYGFLRGRRYRQLEWKCREDNAPDWDRVARLVAKFGHMDLREARQKIAEWSEDPLPADMEAALEAKLAEASRIRREQLEASREEWQRKRAAEEAAAA